MTVFIRKCVIAACAAVAVTVWSSAGILSEETGKGETPRDDNKGLLKVIADKNVSQKALADAIRQLSEVTEPALFWAKIANDDTYNDVHRQGCVIELFRRHIHPGMSMDEIAEMFGGATWLRNENVELVKGIFGVPTTLMKKVGWAGSFQEMSYLSMTVIRESETYVRIDMVIHRRVEGAEFVRYLHGEIADAAVGDARLLGYSMFVENKEEVHWFGGVEVKDMNNLPAPPIESKDKGKDEVRIYISVEPPSTRGEKRNGGMSVAFDHITIGKAVEVISTMTGRPISWDASAEAKKNDPCRFGGQSTVRNILTLLLKWNGLKLEEKDGSYLAVAGAPTPPAPEEIVADKLTLDITVLFKMTSLGAAVKHVGTWSEIPISWEALVEFKQNTPCKFTAIRVTVGNALTQMLKEKGLQFEIKGDGIVIVRGVADK